MDTINNSPVASFTIDHDRLVPGIYVSRKDSVGKETVTTFDIRMKKPNAGPPIGTAAIHTLEHLLAVWLRGHSGDFADKILYVGPMGCRTGMYLLVKGDMEPLDIIEKLKDAFRYIVDFTGPVPAATSAECGAYRDHDLAGAQKEALLFIGGVLNNISENNTVYPK